MGGLVSDLLAIPGLFIIPIFELSSLVTLAVTLVLAPLFEAPAFTSSQAVKAVWFKYLWWWFGPVSKPIFAPSVRPVLEQARGVVLDIGPASGIWIRDLSQSVKAGRVSKIYGVEPNVRFHPQLIANTKAHGIEDVYKPIAAYAQDLKTHGIEEKSIDTIITVHVLCSVGPQVDQVVEQLYQYLKPGGQWLVYEHVGSHNVAVRAWQRLFNTVWPYLADGCDICRDTGAVLRAAADWDSVDLGLDARESRLEGLPHVLGRLVKRT